MSRARTNQTNQQGSTALMTETQLSAASERDAAARMLVVLKERQASLREQKTIAEAALKAAESANYDAETNLTNNYAAIRECESILGIKSEF